MHARLCFLFAAGVFFLCCSGACWTSLPRWSHASLFVSVFLHSCFSISSFSCLPRLRVSPCLSPQLQFSFVSAFIWFCFCAASLFDVSPFAMPFFFFCCLYSSSFSCLLCLCLPLCASCLTLNHLVSSSISSRNSSSMRCGVVYLYFLQFERRLVSAQLWYLTLRS